MVFCTVCFLAYGQTKDTLANDESLVMYIENPPQFKGDLRTFIQQQVNYPETMKIDSIDCKVFVTFWVDTIGKTVEHKVAKGIREDVNNEALRVARLIKFEKPAMQRGKPIRVSYTVPVVFRFGVDAKNFKTEDFRYTIPKQKFRKGK